MSNNSIVEKLKSNGYKQSLSDSNLFSKKFNYGQKDEEFGYTVSVKLIYTISQKDNDTKEPEQIIYFLQFVKKDLATAELTVSGSTYFHFTDAEQVAKKFYELIFNSL